MIARRKDPRAPWRWQYRAEVNGHRGEWGDIQSAEWEQRRILKETE